MAMVILLQEPQSGANSHKDSSGITILAIDPITPYNFCHQPPHNLLFSHIGTVYATSILI